MCTDVNDVAHPGHPITSTTDENIEAVKNRFCITIESLLERLHTVRLMPSNFYVIFRHKKCGSKDCSKIAKFWKKKTMSHVHHSGDVDDVQRRPYLFKKVIIDDESWL